MKIGIALTTNLDIERSSWIEEISTLLKKYFEEMHYGENLKDLILGIICVETRFDFFLKERKPKYYHGKRKIVGHDITIEVENALEYDVKLNYDRMRGLDKIEFKREILNTLLASTEKIRTIKSITDFDLEKFQSDFSLLLKLVL